MILRNNIQQNTKQQQHQQQQQQQQQQHQQQGAEDVMAEDVIAEDVIQRGISNTEVEESLIRECEGVVAGNLSPVTCRNEIINMDILYKWNALRKYWPTLENYYS